MSLKSCCAFYFGKPCIIESFETLVEVFAAIRIGVRFPPCFQKIGKGEEPNAPLGRALYQKATVRCHGAAIAKDTRMNDASDERCGHLADVVGAGSRRSKFIERRVAIVTVQRLICHPRTFLFSIVDDRQSPLIQGPVEFVSRVLQGVLLQNHMLSIR